MVKDGPEMNKAFELMTEFKKANDRKRLWDAITKEKLETVLTTFTQGPLSKMWFVQSSEEVGEEYVNIQLVKQPAVNNPEHLRKGGMLTYMLSHRGKILPVITFPYIEGQVSQNASFVIDDVSIEPSAINLDLITSHINIFLDEMLRWEVGKNTPIGFKTVSDKLLFDDQVKDQDKS